MFWHHKRKQEIADISAIILMLKQNLPQRAVNGSQFASLLTVFEFFGVVAHFQVLKGSSQ